MKNNLDKISTEIQEYLTSRGIAIFYGQQRDGEDLPTIHWDSRRRPDYQAFVAAAEAAGVKLVNMYVNEFDAEIVDDLMDRVDELLREERRDAEKQLRGLRGYAGFVCQIELSFDLGQRVYRFELRTEWFDELNELMHEMDEGLGEDDSLLGGEFLSNN